MKKNEVYINERSDGYEVVFDHMDQPAKLIDDGLSKSKAKKLGHEVAERHRAELVMRTEPPFPGERMSMDETVLEDYRHNVDPEFDFTGV